MPPLRGYSLIGPNRLVCVTERLLSIAQGIAQGIQFHFSVLNRVSFSTGSLNKSMRVGNERCAFVVPTIFFLKKNIYQNVISLKNNL